MVLPSVSVVIPTAGRPAVFAAVASALNQSYEPLEVIVVVDSVASPASASLADISSRVRVFFTGGIGANGARMRGVTEAKGELIAFLDDDDVWFPDKLERQVALWSPGMKERRYWVASCCIAIVNSHGNILRTLPMRLRDTHERVAAYLFRRTTISYGEGLLHTSTLICDRALLEVESWDIHLSRHQDWDWVLRVGDRSDVALHMCPDVLVGVAVADDRSISMSADWRTSLKWVEDRYDRLTARERGDFLLCHTGTIAIRNGSRRGALIAAVEALRSGRPGFRAWLVWAIHMLSPRVVDNITVLRVRLSRRGKDLSTQRCVGKLRVLVSTLYHVISCCGIDADR